jgi:CBS domain-containing protein
MVEDVIQINLETKIKDILNILDKNKISSLSVIDKNNKIVDIISSGDVIRYVVPKDEAYDLFYSIYMEEETEQDILNKKMNENVEDIIRNSENKELITLTATDSFEKAMNLLSKHHFKIIPVLNANANVIGIVS